MRIRGCRPSFCVTFQIGGPSNLVGQSQKTVKMPGKIADSAPAFPKRANRPKGRGAKLRAYT